MGQGMYRCPNCAAGLGSGMAFCPSCGTRFPQPTPGAPAPTPPQAPYIAQPPARRTSSVGTTFALVALIVVVVLGTLWFLNNTRPGLQIKCKYLNDAGACLTLLLTEPVPQTPSGPVYVQPTEDPAVASAAAETRARSAIDFAAASVKSDLSGLAASETTLSHDLVAIPNDLNGMAADVATVKKDRDAIVAEAATGSTDSGTVCGDAATVAGDKATVDGDLATINGDGATINGDIYSVQNGIAYLQRDGDALAAARANLPSYNDDGPTGADVASALTSANSAIDSADQTYAGYLKTANSYVAKAESYSADAAAACDSTR